MKHNMYSIYDDAAGAFLQPFFVPNEAIALRSIKVLIEEDDHNFCKYIKDYSLHFLGTFDLISGRIEKEAVPVPICTLLELKNSEKNK